MLWAKSYLQYSENNYICNLLDKQIAQRSVSNCRLVKNVIGSMLIELWWSDGKRVFKWMRNLVARAISYRPDTDFGEKMEFCCCYILLSFLFLLTNTSLLSKVLSDFLDIHRTAEGREHLNSRSFVGKRK